tara:strand:+ start:94 stop:225 length:132 start_codon:yes stop_codon:yes gene_type:complete
MPIIPRIRDGVCLMCDRPMDDHVGILRTLPNVLRCPEREKAVA